MTNPMSVAEIVAALPDQDRNRHWNGQQWVWPDDVERAVDAANLAISEYYNGDRNWAERWLLAAHEANKVREAK